MVKKKLSLALHLQKNVLTQTFDNDDQITCSLIRVQHYILY